VRVLWPRVIPSADAARTGELAGQLQAKLFEVVRRVVPAEAVEAGPKGERSCREAGCPGGSFGVLLIRQGEGCALVALVGRPGRGLIRLAPWAGEVELKKFEIDFREPPESSARV